MNVIDVLNREQLKESSRNSAPATPSRSTPKCMEGGKERTQMFEGVVIVRKGGSDRRVDYRSPDRPRRRRREDLSASEPAGGTHRGRQARRRFSQPPLLFERKGRQSRAHQGKESQRKLTPRHRCSSSALIAVLAIARVAISTRPLARPLRRRRVSLSTC